MHYQESEIQNFHEQKFEFITVEEKNHILYLTLNRPQKKNAMHPVMMAELAYVATYVRYSKDVWCVVLQAAGDTFCAGADLKAFAGNADPALISTIPKPEGEVLVGQIFVEMHKPVIAKVQGNVFAGGFLLICGCHYVIAAEHAQFGLPEVKRGIWPMQVMASLLPLLPARKVLDLCMRGKVLSANEALDLGIITEIVAANQLDSTVQTLAEEICENAPAAIRLGLEAFDTLRSIPEHEAHAYLRSQLSLVLKTADSQEGIKAFMEKRKPQWTGE